MRPIQLVILVNSALAAAVVGLYLMCKTQAPEVIASEAVWPMASIGLLGLVGWQVYWSMTKLKQAKT
jgi:hypothetical protein